MVFIFMHIYNAYNANIYVMYISIKCRLFNFLFCNNSLIYRRQWTQLDLNIAMGIWTESDLGRVTTSVIRDLAGFVLLSEGPPD